MEPIIECMYCRHLFPDKISLNEHECKKKTFVNIFNTAAANSHHHSHNPNHGKCLTDSEQLYKLVKEVAKLTTKMEKMAKEMSYLKSKQRIQILKSLNRDTENYPKTNIHRWFQSLSVSLSHLSMVIQKSISEAIKQVLLDGLIVAQNVGMNLPIRAYKEKPNILYVFLLDPDENITKWVSCESGMFRKFCLIIASKLMDLYIQNEEYFCNNSLEPDQIQAVKTENLYRVMDTSYTRGNFISKLIETTYDKLKTKWNNRTDEDVEIEDD